MRMDSHTRLAGITFVTLALFTGAPRAGAQDTAKTGMGAYFLGVGANLSHGLGTQPALQMGREWRDPESRMGMRLTLDLNGLARRYAFTRPDFTPYATFDQRTRDLTLGAAVTYALTRGRIQPYLISGFTLERRSLATVVTTAEGTTPQPGDFMTPGSFRETGVDLGLQGGAGLAVRLGRVSVFGEARKFVPVTGTATTDNRANPLTFGIRF
jgi:hypothetical protein